MFQIVVRSYCLVAALWGTSATQAVPVTTEPPAPTSLAVPIDTSPSTKAPRDLADLSDIYEKKAAPADLNPSETTPAKSQNGASGKDAAKTAALQQAQQKAAKKEVEPEDGISAFLHDVKDKVKELKGPKNDESSSGSDMNRDAPAPRAQFVIPEHANAPPKSAEERRRDVIRDEVLLSQLIDAVTPWAIGAGLFYLVILGIQALIRRQDMNRYKNQGLAPPPLRRPSGSLGSSRRR